MSHNSLIHPFRGNIGVFIHGGIRSSDSVVSSSDSFISTLVSYHYTMQCRAVTTRCSCREAFPLTIWVTSLADKKIHCYFVSLQENPLLYPSADICTSEFSVWTPNRRGQVTSLIHRHAAKRQLGQSRQRVAIRCMRFGCTYKQETSHSLPQYTLYSSVIQPR